MDDTLLQECRLTVSTTDACFVFDLDRTSTKETLVGVASIDRRNGRLSPLPAHLPAGTSTDRVVCILGILKLLAGPYLVIATKSETVGSVPWKPLLKIEKITDVAFLQISRQKNSDKVQIASEKKYIALLTKLICDGSFYFLSGPRDDSPNGYDISRSLQSQSPTSESGNSASASSAPAPNREDDILKYHRYDWTYKMRQEFIKLSGFEAKKLEEKKTAGASPTATSFAGFAFTPQATNVLSFWLRRVIRGYVFVKDTLPLGGNPNGYSFTLISRKSVERAGGGRRFTKRGANRAGHVANYVETEQIIAAPTEGSFSVSSFVQVRGSIPLHWIQTPNLAYEPSIKLKPVNELQQNTTLKVHFQRELEIFGRMTVVNLVKEKGGENTIGSMFTKLINYGRDKNLSYVPFDLHKEVGHTKFENLAKLTNMTDKSVAAYGFYSNSGSSAQTGVIRTNCKDNLDRTNLAQSLFAKQVATKQLEKVAPAYSNVNAGDKDILESTLRVSWGENGDAISMQYAGTAAMRSVRIKTGKTTAYGMFFDVTNSIRRYYINNFEDGQNQDALDIFFSKYPLPRQYAIDWKTQQVKKGIKTTLSIVFAFIFKLIQPASSNGISLVFCMIWMALVYLFWAVLRLDTRRIVNLPILRTNFVKTTAATTTTTPAEPPTSPEKDKQE